MADQKNKIRRILTKTVDHGNGIHVTISDTGTGIKPVHLHKIFDPFFTTKDPDQGTGLGLFVSYRIIQDHGGKLWAENNEWDGATFSMELPVNNGSHSRPVSERRLS